MGRKRGERHGEKGRILRRDGGGTLQVSCAPHDDVKNHVEDDDDDDDAVQLLL